MKISKIKILIGQPKSGKNITMMQQIAKLRAKQLTKNPIKQWILSKKIFNALLNTEV